MKYSEISTRTKDELKVMAKELKEKLLNLKFDLSDRKLKNTSQIGELKRNIAKVLTALRKTNS